MQFTRVASLFFFFMTLGLVAMSNPVGITRRQSTSDIDSVLTTLQGNIAPIISQLKTLGSSGNATQAEVTPLVQSLTSQFTTADSSLTALSSSSKVKRQITDTEIATLVAGILTDVADALDGLLGTPGLGDLLPGLDTALSNVLRELEVLLAGVLNLVAVLLVDVAGLLRAIGLGLTLASLGL